MPKPSRFPAAPRLPRALLRGGVSTNRAQVRPGSRCALRPAPLPLAKLFGLPTFAE